jgi:hypothetical protein
MENNMQKRQAHGRNGSDHQQSLKAGSGTRHKNAYVHVISPATASEIRRAVGIKRSHSTNVFRAFADAGVKI